MKNRTIITHLLRAALLLVLLVFAINLMPGVLGQRMSKEAKAEASKASANTDVALRKEHAPRPSAPAACTIGGTLGTAPPGGATGTLPIRLFRGGVVTTCASAPYPGTSGAGPYIYNVHNITNPNAAPLCTNVTLHYVSGGTATVNPQVAAFQAPFAPADISNAARYLGDPGLSNGGPPGTDQSFAVNVPANATIALVVFNTNASPAGSGAVYQINLDQDAYCGPPAPSISAAGSTITAEGCSPPNGAMDPGEKIPINFTLTNGGGAPTTNLVATLVANGGVTNPSAPQNYGVIAPAGTATRPFSFTVDNNLNCGATVTATLQLNDNGNPLPNVTFTFTTGALVASASENFDGAAVPALPAGWTADQGINTAGAPPWVTSNAGVPVPVAASPPNAAFTQDPANLCDNRIYSPVVVYPAGSQLIFQQNYDLEQNTATVAYDAGVLEMNTNGGGWVDIVTAGGTFAAGGYNHTDINGGFMNPLLPTRPNWSGISNGGAGGFEMCAVNLPAAGVGQNVQFRWRMGSDSTATRNGWRIDTVSIAQRVCCVSEMQLDHFKAYQVNPPQPPLNLQVQLIDQFNQFGPPQPRTVLDPFRFANPVDKQFNGNFTYRTNLNGHLKLYNLNPVPQPTPRSVIVKNQFGPQELTVSGSRLLAVPTQKLPYPPPPQGSLDHFQCYDCTGIPLINVVVNLTDQFHFEPQVQVLQPRYLCNPVQKFFNGVTPIVHPDDHLVFYTINQQPPFNIAVNTINQFGSEQNLPLQAADLLGVPSVKVQLDHFKAYPVIPPPPPLNEPVTLQDQFDFPQFQQRTVLAPDHFANPVDKQRGPVLTPRTNPDAHLKLYNLSPVSGPTPSRIVNVFNQFGAQPLRVGGSKLLAVPTQKNGQGQVQNLDHFVCYDCIGSPVNVPVNLTDQFHFEPNVQVLQPRYVCNPVLKIHNNVTTPILHPTDHLVFYAINQQPPFNIAVNTNNQFGQETNLQLQTADLLGVPSLKLSVITRAVSRKTHGGAGPFDVDLPLTGTPGIECRSGGQTKDFTMVVTFQDTVMVTGSPQAAVTSGIGTVGTGGASNGGMVTISGNEVTIPLTNVDNAQTIGVSLNGVMGAGTFTISMSVLLGDVNAGGTVNGTDVSTVRLQSGSAANGGNFRTDVNTTGNVNGTDVSIVRLQSGTGL